MLEIYKLALANDPDYKITTFNQQASHEIKSQSVAQMLPRIGANISSNFNHFDTNKAFYLGTDVKNYWDHSFGVSIRQPIFNWGHWIQLEQADLKIAQAEAENRAKYQALITRTVTAYFNVLAAQDTLEFSQAEKKAIQKQLERAIARYDVGRASRPDVYEAQAAYDRSLASEIAAQNQVDNAKEALREIIGNYPVELKPLQPAIPLGNPVPEAIVEWADNAEVHNYSVIAQINKTEFTRKTIDLQQSRHLPTLDLTAQFRISDSNAQFGFRGDEFAFGLQINIPIFEGGATESRIRQAQYDYEASKEELIKITRSIDRSVKDSYRGVLASIGKVNALEMTTRSAELAVQAAEVGFSSGVRNMVDVLTEQRDLYKAKSDYAKSRYDYLINSIKLKEAVGGLNEEDIEMLNGYLTLAPSTTEEADAPGREQ